MREIENAANVHYDGRGRDLQAARYVIDALTQQNREYDLRGAKPKSNSIVNLLGRSTTKDEDLRIECNLKLHIIEWNWEQKEKIQ